MSLSHAYAQVVKDEGEKAGFLKKFVEYLAMRGHTSLLPEIVRILGRDTRAKGAEVYLARESDHSKFKSEIRDALSALGEKDAATVIDANMVGGFIVRAKSKVVDSSYRSALISIYQNAIK